MSSSSSCSSSSSSSSSSVQKYELDICLDSGIEIKKIKDVFLDIEIISSSSVWGYIKDWYGRIVKKRCKIILSSLDGLEIYESIESDPITGYFEVKVPVDLGTEILLTCFYGGYYKGQMGLSGSYIITTGSSSSSSSSCSF
jgi:hypothetical protein